MTSDRADAGEPVAVAGRAVPHLLDRTGVVPVRRPHLRARAAPDRDPRPRCRRGPGRPPHGGRLGAEHRLDLRRELGRPASGQAPAPHRRRPHPRRRARDDPGCIPSRRADTRPPLRRRPPRRPRPGAVLDRVHAVLRRPRRPRPVPRREREAERHRGRRRSSPAPRSEARSSRCSRPPGRSSSTR